MHFTRSYDNFNADSTFYWVEEMIKGDFVGTYAEKYPLVSMGGLSGGSSVHRLGSYEPDQRHRKLYSTFPNQKNIVDRIFFICRLIIGFVSESSD